MTLMYCMKCKKKREDPNPKYYTTANNRGMLRGKCPKCSTTMSQITKVRKGK
jgi:hypothetical protein